MELSKTEQMQLLDKYDRLFAEAGWKELVEDFREKKEHAKNNLIYGTSGEKELNVVKGQTSVWDYVIGLEATLGRIKEDLTSLPDV